MISLRGHLKAKFGRKALELGREEEEDDDDDESPTVIEITNSGTNPHLKHQHIYQKRTCGDCILLLIGEREKFELTLRQESNKVLKTQMNFTEQKLIEVQNYFMRAISDFLFEEKTRFMDVKVGFIDDSIQNKLIYGLFVDILVNVKNELRRSYKSNGFYEVSNSEFIDFYEERVNILYSMVNQYIHNMFPNRPDFISPNDVIDILEKEKDFFMRIVREVYTNARTVKLEANRRISNVKEEFSTWVDAFIVNNHSSRSS